MHLMCLKAEDLLYWIQGYPLVHPGSTQVLKNFTPSSSRLHHQRAYTESGTSCPNAHTKSVQNTIDMHMH